MGDHSPSGMAIALRGWAVAIGQLLIGIGMLVLAIQLEEGSANPGGVLIATGFGLWALLALGLAAQASIREQPTPGAEKRISVLVGGCGRLGLDCDLAGIALTSDCQRLVWSGRRSSCRNRRRDPGPRYHIRTKSRSSQVECGANRRRWFRIVRSCFPFWRRSLRPSCNPLPLPSTL